MTRDSVIWAIKETLAKTDPEHRGRSPRRLLHDASCAIVDIGLADDDARARLAAIKAIVFLVRWVEGD